MLRDLIKYKVHAGFGTALLILLALALLSYRALDASRQSAGWVNHTRKVVSSLDGLLAAVALADSTSQAFALTGQEQFALRHQTARRQALRYFREASALTSDNLE